MNCFSTSHSISLTGLAARMALGAAGVAVACTAFAGAPVVNPSNGHRYQVFENGYVTWSAAQTACVSLGAHLVTIRDGNEQAFVGGLPLGGYTYWIGGGDFNVEGTNEWVNGEPFAYTDPMQDTNSSTYDYLYYSKDGGLWYHSYASHTQYYICEWDDPGYAHMSILPDVNGNGAPELLLVGTDPVRQQFIVTVRDSEQKVLKTLHFGSDISLPPFGVVALADTNGKGGAEVGVGYVDTSAGTLTIEIKDNSNDRKVVRKLGLMTTDFVPLSMSVSPDENGNGADEISVLARHRTGTPYRVDKIDSKTGALLKTMTF